MLGCAEQSADCVVKSLFAAVAEHSAGEETFDDQTVVAIKVKGGPGKRSERRASSSVYLSQAASRSVCGARDSILHCDQRSTAKLARQFGTPLYVYSASAIRQRVRDFQNAFDDVPHTVCYSVKANSNLSILRLLDDEGLRI